MCFANRVMSGLKKNVRSQEKIWILSLKKACILGQMTLNSVYICVYSFIINLQTLVDFNNKTSGGNFDATAYKIFNLILK